MKSLANLAVVIVGGTGGSGTRALAELLRENGLAMPKPRNSAGDWLALQRFHRVWTKRILTETASLDYDFADLPRAMRQGIEAELAEAFEGAVPPRAAAGEMRFGWKNPRSLFVLPVFRHFFPAMNFVQMVRDGRDMALSKNERQHSLYFELLFREPEPPEAEAQIAAARFWARANVEAFSCGRRLLGERHRVVRYEDACRPGHGALAALLFALGLGTDRIDDVFEESESVGRWQTLSPDVAAAVDAAARPGLAVFGYA